MGAKGEGEVVSGERWARVRAERGLLAIVRGVAFVLSLKRKDMI